MTYRLCICTDKQKGKSAYAVFNQQDLCVYRRIIDRLEEDEEREYVRVCAIALCYFCKNIKSRYYTEHFSELLDEDSGIVLCQHKELVSAFLGYRNNSIPPAEKYSPLAEMFDIRSISFEYAEQSTVSAALSEFFI